MSGEGDRPASYVNHFLYPFDPAVRHSTALFLIGDLDDLEVRGGGAAAEPADSASW